MKVCGKMILAHRLSYLIHRGSIPARIDVLHRCDNPPCCNPDHLFLGSHADNMKDMASKDRLARKLTNAQVQEIRALVDGGMKQKDAAAKYGVTKSLISRLVLNIDLRPKKA